MTIWTICLQVKKMARNMLTVRHNSASVIDGDTVYICTSLPLKPSHIATFLFHPKRTNGAYQGRYSDERHDSFSRGRGRPGALGSGLYYDAPGCRGRYLGNRGPSPSCNLRYRFSYHCDEFLLRNMTFQPIWRRAGFEDCSEKPLFNQKTENPWTCKSGFGSMRQSLCGYGEATARMPYCMRESIHSKV